MIKQRDYAGLMPNYQQLGAQQGQIWGGATQELFKALSQMLAQREADNYFGKFDVQSTTPQQNVTTDLLGRPITQTTSGYGGMPVTSRVPAGRRDVTTTQTVDYSQDPQRLIAGLMNANPEIARRAQAGIQGIQLRQPNFQNIPEGGTAVDRNPLSPTYGGAIAGRQKTTAPNLPEGFANLTPAKKAEVYNQTYGTNFTAGDFEKPINVYPTELSKYQNELDEIIKLNPRDPRIPAYRDVINKLRYGVDTYSTLPTSEGIRSFSTKRGEVGDIIAQPAPTADMRNKNESRKLVTRSIDEIKALSESLITKIGPAQRAEAIKRGASSVLGKDPQFTTYQDARKALAGNLAVAQQGSRPSDADILSIWLPLVPDVFRDTKESAEMKWKLIRSMSLPTIDTGSAVQSPLPSVGAVEDGYRFKGGDPADPNNWEKQ